MTVVAIRNGIIAADSRVTWDTEAGGTRMFNGEKLFRKFPGTKEETILATAGDSFAAMVFIDWYGSGKDKPTELIDGEADFHVVALTREGMFEYDQWCRGVKVLEPFYAIGCGAKAALGAMHVGSSAKRAVEVACLIDPYCAPPITVWKLSRLISDKPNKTGRKRKTGNHSALPVQQSSELVQLQSTTAEPPAHAKQP